MALRNRFVEIEFLSDTQRIVISGLHISFRLVKTLSSAPSEGWVKIKNLNKSTESFIQKEANRILIRAGYEGVSGIIFGGDLRDVETGREDLNHVTTITIGSGVQKLSESFFQRSYAGTIQIQTIITDALEFCGLTPFNLSAIPNVTLEDVSWNGRTFDLIDEITSIAGIDWFEDNEKAYFHKPGEAVETIPIQVNEQTGMVGVPKITDTGIQVSTLLNPAVALGGLIELESIEKPETTGKWKVTKLTVDGDNRIGKHQTMIDGVAQNG